MNKDRILAVADAIEKHSIPDLGFNMQYFVAASRPWTPDRSGAKCGTVACIAGWTRAVRNGAIPKHAATIHDFRYHHEAQWLGIDAKDARALFLPEDLPGGPNYDSITPAHAVAVLRHLAEIGKVDWSVGAP
jgi:hypothetical protein